MEIKEMKTHRYAAWFPMWTKDRLKELAEDIRANGQKLPIILDQHGQLIDGRNRLAACALLGIKPLFETRHYADDRAVLADIKSLNFERRDLTESQRAMIAAQIANMREGGDKRSKNHSANLQSDNPEISRAEAAEMLDVSERSVNSAKRVLNNGTPELQEAVRNGEMKVYKAEKVAMLPPEQQTEAIKKGKASRKASGTKRKAKPKKGKLHLYKTPEPFPFEAMIDRVKKLGRVPQKQFYERLGGTEQEWSCFIALVRAVHYMRLLEDNDSIELLIDDKERDLATAVERQLERIQHACERGNSFKFEFPVLKNLTKELYDMVRLASAHETKAKQR
jgi:ParB-like chromosome segregation protein Spo0J